MPHDDPFSDDESVRTWVEIGPPQKYDTVKVTLTGTVMNTYDVHGVPVVRVVLDSEQFEQGGGVEVRADSVAVVKRAES